MIWTLIWTCTVAACFTGVPAEPHAFLTSQSCNDFAITYLSLSYDARMEWSWQCVVKI